VNLLDPSGLDAASGAAVGAEIGGTIVLGGSIVVDAATGGINLLGTPGEVIEGATIGGIIGGEIGALTSQMKGERNWEKGRGDDPYWSKTPDELKQIENDANSTPAECARAKRIRKQKERKQKK